MPTNYGASRYQLWVAQLQTTLLAFNNTTGTWSNTGAQLIRVDQNSVTTTRNAPYSRFPVLTGTRSEVAGIRGRKLAAWSMRGVPFIPSGAAGTAPDLDIILQSIFGQVSTKVASTSVTYGFSDTGYLPFSLFGFVPTAVSTLTQRAIWGCFVTRITWNFNGLFLTCDLEGFAGYEVDNVGMAASVFDLQALAGLTTFPTVPSGLTTNGQPIAGFGNGYTATIDSQNISLKVRVASITLETGFTPVADVYGSPYLAAVVGASRRASIQFSALDDDSTALNDIKAKADTDNTSVSATIVAGTVPGSIVTIGLSTVQLNAFSLRDDGPMQDFEVPVSYAHTPTVGTTTDMSLVLT
jgi:hypothetical protein